jgi:GalNAc-alpha-(1->4)-GalNAc-alpha-(1->3)-diNAcBac-PP-undecaprenol alpha-1,4-N-acetyl-D-galactosaminyltransferase
MLKHKRQKLDKYCLVISDLNCGGSQRVLVEISNFLACRGKEVTILLLFRQKSFFYRTHPSIKIIQPDYYYKSVNLKILNTILFIRQSINLINPDIILSFHHRYNPIVILSLLFSGYPVFVSDRANPYSKLSPVINEILRNLLYPYSKGLVVQTKLSAKVKKEKKLNDNIYVMPNPLTSLDYSDNQKDKENIITNVARMDEGKGHKELLKAFSILRDRKSWKLMLIGNGKLMPALIQEALDLNISDDVIFIGESQEVAKLLKRSRIFAFTSFSEGFPNALMEAMAMGLPCVSFDCVSGPSDLITEGQTGYLVKTGDIIELSDKIQLLIDEDLQRDKIGTNAKYVREYYRSEKLISGLVSFFENTLLIGKS